MTSEMTNDISFINYSYFSLHRFLKTDDAEKACTSLSASIGINPLLLKELDLSKKKKGDSGVKQLSALLKDSHCTLQTLRLVLSLIVTFLSFRLKKKTDIFLSVSLTVPHLPPAGLMTMV